MGNTFRRLFDGLFGNREMRVVMLGTSLGCSCLVMIIAVIVDPYATCVSAAAIVFDHASGLDAAGKTTILYKLHIGEVLSTVPTIGKRVD